MDTPNANTLLDRLDAARAQREAELAARRRPPASTAARLGWPYAPGDRVFDAITGEHGRVARVEPAGNTGSLAVLVQLDSGAVVTRGPGDLIDRPSER